MTKTIQTYLRYALLTGIFIIPFIPFIVANSFFFPFITGKGFAFRIIVEILLGVWAILAVINPAYRPQKSWILWCLLGFIAVIGIADALGVNPSKSFWSNYERMEGFITLLHLGAYFLIISAALNTERLWNWFWNTTLAASFIMVLYGFLQISGAITINQGGVRLDGTMGNATYLAVYMLFHIFIATLLIMSRKHFLFMPQINSLKNKLIIGLPVILMLGIILYKTATRGAMLGFIAGVFIAALLIVLFERHRPQLKKVAIGIITTSVVVVLGFIAIKNTAFVQNSPVLNRFATISLNDRTTASRFILADMSFQGFKERPILGWGQENFNYVFNKYYDPALYGQEQWFDRTHNVVTDWLMAGGILGLVGYLSLYGALLFYIWRGKKDSAHFTIPEKSVLTGLLVAYFIHNLFVFDNLISYIMFLSLAAYVHNRVTEHDRLAAHHTAPVNRFIAPVALVATLLILYTVNAKPMQANTNLIKAFQTQAPLPAGLPAGQVPYNGDVTKNLEMFKEIVALDTFGTTEVREQMISIASSLAASQFPVTGRNEFIAYAMEQIKAQVEETSTDARHYVIYGSFLNRIGQYPEAVSVLTKASELSPGKQTIMFELASAHTALQQFPQAEQILKKAYELDPNYQEARVYYAAGAIYAKNSAVAESLLKDLPRPVFVSSDIILQAYHQTGQRAKVIEIMKERIAL
ncbi:MAG: O-antigen ligase family protein, partial [bacterium]|nr:O-antigen ligase family protein [bacterium]